LASTKFIYRIRADSAVNFQSGELRKILPHELTEQASRCTVEDMMLLDQDEPAGQGLLRPSARRSALHLLA
jgi:hypothetical protein